MSLPLNGTWTTAAPMPTARRGFGCEIIGCKIYCIGGTSASPSWNDSQTNVVEIYDTTTNEWTTGAPAPRKVYYPGTAVYNNKIYMFGGGYTRNNAYNNVSIYDPESNTWSEALTTLPSPRWSLSCCTVDNKIYCIGGSNYPSFYNRVDIYDVENNTWSTGQNIPEPINDSCCLHYSGKLFVVAGLVGDGKATNKVYSYDIKSNSWEHITNFVSAISSHCADILEDKIYVAYPGFHCYDISRNEWTQLPAPKTSRRPYHQHAIVNNKFYLIGGTGSSNITEIYPAEPLKPLLHVLLQVTEQAQLSLVHDLTLNPSYKWSSDNETIATVDSNGVVTANSVGETFITCRDENGFTELVSVKVVPEDEEILLALHLTEGESKRLWLTDDVDNVTWLSSNPNVAEVDEKGKVTGIKYGLVNIDSEYNGDISSIYVRVNSA